MAKGSPAPEESVAPSARVLLADSSRAGHVGCIVRNLYAVPAVREGIAAAAAKESGDSRLTALAGVLEGIATAEAATAPAAVACVPPIEDATEPSDSAMAMFSAVLNALPRDLLIEETVRLRGDAPSSGEETTLSCQLERARARRRNGGDVAPRGAAPLLVLYAVAAPAEAARAASGAEQARGTLKHGVAQTVTLEGTEYALSGMIVRRSREGGYEAILRKWPPPPPPAGEAAADEYVRLGAAPSTLSAADVALVEGVRALFYRQHGKAAGINARLTSIARDRNFLAALAVTAAFFLLILAVTLGPLCGPTCLAHLFPPKASLPASCTTMTTP